MTTPLEYFRARVSECDWFRPVHFDCEDMNLRAFASRDEFRQWYGQPPGSPGNPYRDEGFYTRELARASLHIRPRRIVELGTSLGIGTVILSILNPYAHITTVDNRPTIPAGDGKEYHVGHIAQACGCDYEQQIETSWQCHYPHEVDLVFIDAEHTYEAVMRDSVWAWRHRSARFSIVWHDCNERHPGVMRAVREFCARFLNIDIEFDPRISTAWVSLP